MRLDFKKIVVITLLTLISGTVTASDMDSSEYASASAPAYHRGAGTTYPSKTISNTISNTNGGSFRERCPACRANGTSPENALVPALAPVTDFLSFAAAADPQINKSTNRPRAAFQNDIARFLLTKLYKDNNYKGLIIAGDLTEHTYKWEILKFYNTMLASEEDDLSPIFERSKQLDRLYEGLGNHDMRKGTCCTGDAVGNNCVCDSGLTRIISRVDRRDQKNSQPPHYSWEWDGIRFIQLNLLPGDEAETVWNGFDRDPEDALSFLKDELEDAGPDKNVIVVHHYGMDRFSNKWWSTETKKAYGELISDYRVVAIITGHLHWSRRPSNMQQCWNGVTAVTVGSLRLGFHLDFKIVDDHLTVSRLRNGAPRWSDSYSIGQDATRFCGENT